MLLNKRFEMKLLMKMIKMVVFVVGFGFVGSSLVVELMDLDLLLKILE